MGKVWPYLMIGAARVGLSHNTLNTHTVVTVNNKVLYTRIVQPPVFT